MATLRVIGSGSSGNCYVIECERQSLVLDLGLPWNEILNGLKYDISKVIGCLVTHSHADHASSISSALMYQLPVYSNKSTVEKFGGVILNNKTTYNIGEFKVMPLKVPHGDTECFSFVIRHEEVGTILFCTDLTNFPYTIPNVQYILIEANYSREALVDNMCDNTMGRSHPENHLSIDSCCEILNRHKGVGLNNVMLIHLSRTNSDEEDFCNKVKSVIGYRPVVAHPNVSISIDRDEF